MHRSIAATILSAILSTPAGAMDWRDQSDTARLSGFAGARLKIPLGGKGQTPLSAQLTIAPARSGVSADGMVRTRVSEGVGIELAGAKPRLMIAGQTAADLKGARQKMGISTLAWVGIGVTVVAIGGFLLWADAVRDSGD